MRFSDEMAQACSDIWNRMHTHPFVKGIGNGTLERDSFIFYLKQDYVYLIEFSRLIGILVAKSPDLETMITFKDILKDILETEMDLHRRICAAFGVDAGALEKVQAAPYCRSYTSHLLAAAYGGAFADGVAALLPCAWGYLEVGLRLKEQGLPDDEYYSDWINTYSGENYAYFINYLRDLMDSIGADASSADKERYKTLFAQSVESEVMFWEMGYKKIESIV